MSRSAYRRFAEFPLLLLPQSDLRVLPEHLLPGQVGQGLLAAVQYADMILFERLENLCTMKD